MTQWKRELLILWFGIISSAASYTMVIPFLPLYLLDLGANPENVNFWSGLIFSATFLFGAIMAPVWGAIADKYGQRKMIIRAGFSLAIIYSLGAFVRDPYELLAVRILQGFASGLIPAAMAFASLSAPKNQVGWSLGILQTATAAGSILGPLFGGVSAYFFDIRTSFILAAVPVFLGTLAVCFWVREIPPAKENYERNMFDDFKIARYNKPLLFMLLIMLLVNMTVMMRQPIITLYVDYLASDAARVVLYSGIIFSLAGVAGIIAAPFWGRLGQMSGFYKILTLTLVGAGIVNTLHLFVGSLWHFGVLQFIYGIFLAGTTPAINTIVAQNTDFNFRGRAMGMVTTANQLGQMSGPLVGGALGLWFSFEIIFVFAGVILLIAAFSVWKTSFSNDEKLKLLG
jgi:DHA1 family multidrug resistance protein-like MFS transporter